MGVYKKVIVREARDGGHTILAVRWVEVKKATGTHRSGLVSKEIKNHSALELFAATPPSAPLTARAHAHPRPWQLRDAAFVDGRARPRFKARRGRTRRVQQGGPRGRRLRAVEPGAAPLI